MRLAYRRPHMARPSWSPGPAHRAVDSRISMSGAIARAVSANAASKVADRPHPVARLAELPTVKPTLDRKQATGHQVLPVASTPFCLAACWAAEEPASRSTIQLAIIV